MLTFILLLNFGRISSETCGPEGYNAEDLLSPNYWFFDLNGPLCPPIPPNEFVNTSLPINSTSCRVYFNLCKNMAYRCSGTVCVRYPHNEDYVSLLGKYHDEPFLEGKDSFKATYTGERLPCSAGLMPVKTVLHFLCNENATWNVKSTVEHGGAQAPPPITKFNHQMCQYDVYFNYSEACFIMPENDKRSTSMSNGSFILVLVIPGFALYFVVGMLFNKMRGKEGADIIPNRAFWADLPDLIMDGFVFTMATVTCRHEDRFTNYQDIPDS